MHDKYESLFWGSRHILLATFKLHKISKRRLGFITHLHVYDVFIIFIIQAMLSKFVFELKIVTKENFCKEEHSSTKPNVHKLFLYIYIYIYLYKRKIIYYFIYMYIYCSILARWCSLGSKHLNCTNRYFFFIMKCSCVHWIFLQCMK